MFHHNTYGSVYALTLSSGFKLKNNILIGINFYRYSGIITSKIKGDNHGRDSDKWASLENSLNGMNFRIGLIFKRKKINLGFILESPYKMNVKVKKSISEIRTFEYLFPNYNQTKWNMPLIIGAGICFKGYKNWKFNLDLEKQQYKKSDVKLCLYEFGGEPNWKDIFIIRTGIELYPFKWKNLPIRIGYAYLPQLYASNISEGKDNRVLSYKDTEQNIKHLFTTGTTVKFSKFYLNIGLEYSFLKWRRDYNTYIFVKDDYTESNITLFSEIIFNLK
ncbi:hypothetical protein DRQ09_10145 [candidate division KSB1 bacterium]|nr:MAG: hypothetical protein DRQ09_10145 [candidate division KSB1 bacterium]